MRNRLYRDLITIIGRDGTMRGELRAVVDKNRIITEDASMLVEVGDTIERALPHGTKETLVAKEVQFHRGTGRRGIQDCYDITTERPGTQTPESRRADVSVFVSESPNSRVNLNSIDNSSNVVNMQARDTFQETRHLIETSVEDIAQRALLLQSMDDMEAAHQSGDFVASSRAELD